MGSGKSETAHLIADFLSDGGATASYFDENDMSHPADYAFHAFIRDDQIRTLTPEEQQQLYSEGTKRLSGIVIPLTKISVSLFGKILPYKIYEHLDWETEKPLLLERWLSFAKKAPVRSKIYVFNSGILQNPISEMMMRFDFGYPIIWDYIFSVYRTIAQLNPVIVYIKSTDIKARVEEEAFSRNASWLRSAIESYTIQGYGKRNGLTGLDGYVDCLEARQRIELKLLNELPIEKLILTDPFKNWEDAQKRLCEYLNKKSIARIS
jgi:hypothetical protein